MILLETSANPSKNALSQLLLGHQNGKHTDTFSKIMQQLSLKQGEGEATLPFVLQAFEGTEEGADALDLLTRFETLADTSGEDVPETLLQLLKGGAAAEERAALNPEERSDLRMLQPSLEHRLDADALRQLIRDARAYLKSKISEISQPETMPQTLRGLVELAHKVGIDVTKITVEEVTEKSAQTAKNSETALSQTTAKSAAAETAPAGRSESRPLFHTDASGTPTPRRVSEEPTTEELVRTKESDRSAPAEAKSQAPLRTLLQEQESTENTKTARPEPVRERPVSAVPTDADTDMETAPEVKTAVRDTESARPAPKSDTAVNAQEGRSAVARNGEGDPGTRQNGSDSGARQSAAAATADVSATAEARSAKALFEASLSQLLTGEGETAASEEDAAPRLNDAAPKSSAQTTAAAAMKEELDLKIGEAKQMVRHFAGEIKEAIQNYKPPFTRIKVQLNPAKLGEVDVTMVQRGNNVHINISSNAAAVTTLAQNATELRTQLAQNGMGNATMNFSSQADTQQQQQQHQQQQRQQLAELYDSFETSDTFDLVEQLEIIVPRYV